MADKRIIELEERSTLVNNDFIATDNTNGTAKVNGAILGQKKDSASLVLYGSTNTSGSTITSGTFFYLNGDLVKALANIAANASFTLNTNYKVVSIGEELSSLNNELTIKEKTVTVTTSQYTGTITISTLGITNKQLVNIYVEGTYSNKGVILIPSAYNNNILWYACVRTEQYSPMELNALLNVSLNIHVLYRD